MSIFCDTLQTGEVNRSPCYGHGFNYSRQFDGRIIRMKGDLKMLGNEYDYKVKNRFLNYIKRYIFIGGLFHDKNSLKNKI